MIDPIYASTSPQRSRPVAIALIIGRVVFGLIFVGAAFAKIGGVPMMVEEFGQIGLGQWFRYATGLIELAGALLLVRPATVSYGAGLLTCVSLGAFLAQIMVLHQDFIHTLVFAALLALIAYCYLDVRRPPGRSAV